ncbi:putative gag-pol polyprotein [Tanacetum coccineum]
MSGDLRRLLARLLDTNPSTRITIDEIISSPWFKKGSKGTMFYECEDEEFLVKPEQNAKTASLNAFDIISFSSGLNLSPFFDNTPNSMSENVRIKRRRIGYGMVMAKRKFVIGLRIIADTALLSRKAGWPPESSNNAVKSNPGESAIMSNAFKLGGLIISCFCSEEPEAPSELVIGIESLDSDSFGVNHKMTNVVPAPPTDPPNTMDGSRVWEIHDLFLFARVHPNYVRVIMDALKEFKNVLGLVSSIPKSTSFFCNVPNALKDIILSSMSVAKGGLGIRRIEAFNIALIATHIWCILINKESLWVQWIHSYKLKGRIFWDMPCLGDASWGWRKLLQIRPHVRPFIWHKINNGMSTSMWFDRWADPCPLRDMIMVRNIVCSGFSLSSTVSDLISNGSWRWPHDWSSRFSNVFNIYVPDINSDLDDVIVWRDIRGVFQRFSIAGAWDSLRLRADVIDWYHVVWFPHCIPRHASHLWLVIKEKLKTQDRLRQWDVGPSNLLRCPLCDMVPDSHSYLFFECSFASQVWFQVRASTSMSFVPPRLVDVLAFLIQSKGSSVSNVISRLVLAATNYCLWNERNLRLFEEVECGSYYSIYYFFGTDEAWYFQVQEDGYRVSFAA